MNETPEKINLFDPSTWKSNTYDKKPPKVNEFPPLTHVGFTLSKAILYIIAGTVLFVVVYLFVKDFDASKQIEIIIPKTVATDSANFSHQLQLVQAMAAEKKNYRDFIMQIIQMILLNLLLPILTAILGYIFGSKNADSPDATES